MATGESQLPKRLVICVDGTWCTEDGVTLGPNQTNIYRIWTSVQNGPCHDPVTGTRWYQETQYIKGLGTGDELDTFKRWIAGAFGKGYSDQIRKIYRSCCNLGEQDEVWLYGFSRGAFVVRAVAGLLYHLRSIKSTKEQFEKDYKEATSLYELIRRSQNAGAVDHFLREKTKPAPRIKFVGALDTVKALRDADLHDISYNDGVQHMRHALALHEDRDAMDPECVYPPAKSLTHSPKDRTFVQAWFVGNHMDLGGSKIHDGLSLYPLQWILGESQKLGLALGFVNMANGVTIDNPLHLVSPECPLGEQGPNMHTFTNRNGIETRMHDMRSIHRDQYKISLNKHRSLLWKKRPRNIFGYDEQLNGYHRSVPQGTIVHPSVYFLLFFHSCSLTPMNPKESELQRNLSRSERSMLGVREHLITNHGFWTSSARTAIDVPDERWPIRIMVCGNAGVGKSTLINKVFGVPVAEPSERKAGVHDIRKPYTWDQRPDLVLHDSCGFEAASEQEMSYVDEFLEEMSGKEQPKDRLHVIWFCVPAMANRNMQHSTVRLFKSISKYASGVPLVLVATQTDNFLNIENKAKWDELRGQGHPANENLETICKEFADAQLTVRAELIEAEMRQVMDGKSRMEACVPVSKDDKNSIMHLTDVTIDSIDSDEVRILCIGAQTANIKPKIDAAITQVMKSYQDIYGSITGLSAFPGAATAEKTAVVIAVCKQVIICFGLPTVIDFGLAYEILKTNVWDDMGNSAMIMLAESIATLGLLGTIATFGMPVFLASHAINVALVVPAIARLYFILACDLILVLIMCFKESAETMSGQPTCKDLADQARQYRWSGMSKEVHKRVKALIPRHNLIASYQTGKIREGLQSIIQDYKEQIFLRSRRSSLSTLGRLSVDDSSEEDSLVKDADDLRTNFIELAAEPVRKLGDNVF